MTLVDSLRKTGLFGGLAERDLATIAAQMREQRFGGGQNIFTRGDKGQDVYLVTEGRVRLSILTPDGRELSFTHAVAGDIFGEIAALDGGERSADATALVETRVMTLSITSLDRMLSADPAFARAMIAFLCQRLRATSDHLESLAMFPIEVRLARFLLHAMGPERPDAAATSTRLVLGMTQSELAMLLGASRPKVNAAIAVLETGGAVQRDGQDLECNREILMQFGQF